ncbi:MAG: hypothetical protein KC493_17405, partial [Bacteriovoracaceae bacterium]|nr:hypothetical protein [Bacteriovoracaceae bacterium]
MASSIMRTADSYNEVSDTAHWFSESPQTKKFSMFPFNIRLCSASGESIIFKKSMIFEIEKKDTKWKLSQRAAFEFHDGTISFLWHRKYNFDEENIP